MAGPRGTRNGASKLDEEKVRYIRQHHRPHFNTKELATKFNVACQTINAVTNGLIWGWVDQESNNGPH